MLKSILQNKPHKPVWAIALGAVVLCCTPHVLQQKGDLQRSAWHLLKPPQSGTAEQLITPNTSTAQIFSPYTNSYSAGRQKICSSEIQIANLQSLISIYVQLPKVPLSHRTNCCKLIKEQLRDVSQQREMCCDETIILV